MNLVFLVVIGAAAGFIATRLMKIETDLVTTIAIGIFGALVGGLVLTVGGWMSGFVGAVLGSMLLIWLWRRYGPRR
jgi:uncharacterized membrane protein YeaQ/YmgE (transglycosylase-associated protein family)